MSTTALRSVLTILLLVSFSPVAFSNSRPLPDLRIKQFKFPPTSPQVLRVQVANLGKSSAGPNKLRLTVRQIRGNSVGRTTEVEIPTLIADRSKWLVIDVSTILPQNVSLRDTVFKLYIDPDNTVNETNEANNVLWHGLANETEPQTSATSDTQALSDTPREQRLPCTGVSPRWLICGSVKRTQFVVGVGIRFSKIDPNGRIVATRSYDDCSKLAADHTIPAVIRARAAGPCQQSLQLATRAAAAQ